MALALPQGGMDAQTTQLFRLVIGRPGASGETRATRVSQISVEVFPEEFRSGGGTLVQTARTAAQTTRIQIELPVSSRRPEALESWWEDTNDSSKPLPRGTLDIYLLDSEGNDTSGFRLTNAWPCRSGHSPFGTSASAQTLSLLYDFVFESIEPLNGSSTRQSSTPKDQPSGFGATQSRSMASRQAKEAIRLMKASGKDRAQILNVLSNAELETLSVETAGPNTWGVRRYGGKAVRQSSWVAESITSTRNTTAVRMKWGNTMKHVEMQQIRPGTKFIRCRAKSQGPGADGGDWQYYVLNPKKDLLLV